MKRQITLRSAYSLAETQKILALVTSDPDMRTGGHSKLCGEISDTTVRLYRRVNAPESYLQFHGALREQQGKTVLEGNLVTSRFETAFFAIVAVVLAALAVLVEVFSMSRDSTIALVGGTIASVALLVLGYRVIRFHRNSFLREAESLVTLIQNVLGEDGA